MPTGEATDALKRKTGIDENEVHVEVAQDDDPQAKKQRVATVTTQPAKIANKTEDKVNRSELRPLRTVDIDICAPYLRSALLDPTEPRTSTFIPNSSMMFYILKEMDSMISQNHHFCQSTSYWYPYISRLYYGILFVIHTARVQRSRNLLPTKDGLFLDDFLKAYPPESLTIAGPLMTEFKSICASYPQYANVGPVVPVLPRSDDLLNRHRDGRPRPKPHNWLIPNIPELVGITNLLLSDAYRDIVDTPQFPKTWKATEPIPRSGRSTEPSPALINGYNWRPPPPRRQTRTTGTTGGNNETDPAAGTSAINDDDETALAPPDTDFSGSEHDSDEQIEGIEDIRMDWYWACPGLCYEPECTKDTLSKFVNYGYRLEIPEITASKKFGTLQKFLNLEDLSWFSRILSVMTGYNAHFQSSGNLGQCPLTGLAANQVICRYLPPTKPLLPPGYPGDRRYKPEFAFKAMSYNPTLTDTEQKHGFVTQLNTLTWPDHPWLDVLSDFRTSYARGPIWDSTRFTTEGINDSGYLAIGATIRKFFFIDRPKI